MHFDVDGWLDVAKENNISDNSWDRGNVEPSHLVIHGTAGGSNGNDTLAYEASVGVSTHFAISTNGEIWQGVPCNRAAWGNAPLKSPLIDFAHADLNPNLWTISIEFCKPDSTNEINITDAQRVSGFLLIRAICDHYGIPKRKGDESGGIIRHADINSIDRARCPGAFPFDELWQYLSQGGVSMGVPAGWKDNGTILTAPNGHTVSLGFRDYVLNHSWDSNNWPLEESHGQTPLELSNPSLGGGTQQIFRTTVLEWTPSGGVFVAWVGQELLALRKQSPQNAPQPPIVTINVSQAISSLQAMQTALQSMETAIQSVIKDLEPS